jgi:hypothetical protein
MITEFTRNRPIGRSVPKAREKFSQWNSCGITVNAPSFTVWSLARAIDTTNTNGAERIAETMINVP